MADEVRSADDDLSERMREVFRLLAEEAGRPPQWDAMTLRPARRPVGTARIAVGLALVVVGSLVAVLVLAGGDAEERVGAGPSTSAASSNRPLLETRWWLVSATEADGSVPVPTTGTPYLGLRFGSVTGGVNAAGSDACNGFTRAATVRPDTIELGDQIGPTTLMACSGGLADVLQTFFRTGEFAYRISGDELELTSTNGEVALTYKAIDTPFGPTSSLIVDHGESDAGAYRLVWDEGDGLEFETTAFAALEGVTGSAGVGADPGRVNAMVTSFEGRPYLFGIVPASTAQVIYEPSDGGPEQIALHDVGDPDFLAIGQFLEEDSRTWHATAYDAAGNEIHRLQWGEA